MALLLTHLTLFQNFMELPSWCRELTIQLCHSCGTGYNYNTGSVLGLGTSTYHACGEKNSFLTISYSIIIHIQDAYYNEDLIHSYIAYTFSLGAFIYNIISSSVSLYNKPTQFKCHVIFKKYPLTPAHSNHQTSFFL